MADTQPPGRMRLWLRVLLGASLALNLLIVGVALGAALKLRDRRDDGRSQPTALIRDLGLGPYLWALSGEDRDALRRAADGERQKLRGNRSEMRGAFVETLAALRAEPFDAVQFRAMIARQAEIADRGRRLGLDLLTTRVAEMAPAERAAFAARLERALKRHRPPRD